MGVRFTKHAMLAMAERELPAEWAALTITAPDWIEPDGENPALTRSFKRIPQAGDRVLRVVHRDDGGDILVITAFLDRGAKR